MHLITIGFNLVLIFCALERACATCTSKRLVGTAPFCNGQCSDCKAGEVCTNGNVKDNCLTGSKAECSICDCVSTRLVGTAPFCNGLCSDCGTGETCTNPTVTDNCWTGSKAACSICGPPGGKTCVYNRLVGTAPFCNGRCSDCSSTETCTKGNVESNCWSGSKAECSLCKCNAGSFSNNGYAGFQRT